MELTTKTTENPSVQTLFANLVAGQEKLVGVLAENEARRQTQDNLIKALTDDLAATKKQLDTLQKGRLSVSLPGVEDEAAKRGFMFGNVLRGLAFDDWGDGFELEILKEANKTGRPGKTKAADSTSTGTTGQTGGYLIPVELAGPIIEMYAPAMVLSKLGIQAVPITGSDTFQMPYQTSLCSAYYDGEEAALQNTKPEWGQKQATPHRCGAYTKISKRFLRVAIPGAEQFIRQDLMNAVARRADKAGILGDGADNTPQGVISLIGTGQRVRLGADGNTGKTISLDDTQSLIGVLEDGDAMEDAGSYGFLSHPRLIRALKRQRVPMYSGDTGGEFVMLPMNDQMLQNTTGYAWAKTTNIPTNLTKGSATGLTELIFGNWRQLLQFVWQGLEIGVSDTAGNASGSAFLQDQLWVKVSTENDFMVRQAKAFAYCDDFNDPTF